MRLRFKLHSIALACSFALLLVATLSFWGVLMFSFPVSSGGKKIDVELFRGCTIVEVTSPYPNEDRAKWAFQKMIFGEGSLSVSDIFNGQSLVGFGYANAEIDVMKYLGHLKVASHYVAISVPLTAVVMSGWTIRWLTTVILRYKRLKQINLEEGAAE